MKRVTLTPLVLFGASVLIFSFVFLLSKTHTKLSVSNIEANENTAALYHSAQQPEVPAVEGEQSPDATALDLSPAGINPKDTSTQSPMDKTAIGPSSRVAPGFPSATSTRAIRIPVLVYHTLRPLTSKGKRGENAYNVPPDLLKKELAYLQDNGYTTITYQDILEARAKKKPLPVKPIILSFDDGLIDHYTVALPELKKLNMKALFYIYPNPVDHENRKWMSWGEIEALRDAGMEIGSHTHTHPYLTRIIAPTWEQEKKLLAVQIDAPKAELESKLNIKVLSIAYPFGLYNARVINQARGAGYDFGRTISPGVWQDPAHDLEWSAQIMTDNFKLFESYLARK